jgi:transcriptional regulator with XRE-family HTH domain
VPRAAPVRRQTVPPILKAIAERMRLARDSAGLTQEEASHRAKIGVKRWQVLEAGEANFTIRTLVRVANALGVSVWSLLEKP